MTRHCSLLFATFLLILPSNVQGQTNIHSVVMGPDSVVVQGEIASGTYSFRSQSDGTGEMMVLPKLTAQSSLLANDEVLRELEIVDDQRSELARIQKEFARRMNALTLLPLDQASIMQVGGSNLCNALDGIEEERQSRINDVLMPQQLARLKQISFQETLRERGDGAVLAGKTIANALGIDDAQKKRIKNRAAEIEKEINAKIAKLRTDGRKELLKELTVDQQRRLKEMTGQTFRVSKSTNLLKQIEKFRSTNEK